MDIMKANVLESCDLNSPYYLITSKGEYFEMHKALISNNNSINTNIYIKANYFFKH